MIRRKPGSNEPDGVLEENALYLALTECSKGFQPSPNALLNVVKKGAEIYARYGFTTVQEGRATKGVYEALNAAAAEGSLPVDVLVYVDYLIHPDAHTWGVSRTYTNRLRLAGVKLTFDGSPQGRTAWLTQPFYKHSLASTTKLKWILSSYFEPRQRIGQEVSVNINWTSSKIVAQISHCRLSVLS